MVGQVLSGSLKMRNLADDSCAILGEGFEETRRLRSLGCVGEAQPRVV